jgi:hypothetical protein
LAILFIVNNVIMTLAILFIPFCFLVPNLLTLGVFDLGYSRNTSCALN